MRFCNYGFWPARSIDRQPSATNNIYIESCSVLVFLFRVVFVPFLFVIKSSEGGNVAVRQLVTVLYVVKSDWGSFMNGCKIFVLSFHVIVCFLAFWEAGLEMRRRKGRIFSRREQSCSVQKIRWGCVGCGVCSFVFYHIVFLFVDGRVLASLQ